MGFPETERVHFGAGLMNCFLLVNQRRKYLFTVKYKTFRPNDSKSERIFVPQNLREAFPVETVEKMARDQPTCQRDAREYRQFTDVSK